MNPETLSSEQIQAFMEATEKRVKVLETSPPLAYHTHTGYDMNKVEFGDISRKIKYLHWTLPGATAATAANYGTIFIAPVAMIVVGFKEVHETAGSDPGTVTIQLEKLTGTTAPASGTALLSSALSLKATANTVQTGTLTATKADLNLAAGDRLAIKDAGTLTAVAGVCVLVELQF